MPKWIKGYRFSETNCTWYGISHCIPTDRADSICFTGSSTCCSVELQNTLSRLARKEFLKSFHSHLVTDSPHCASLRANNKLLKGRIRRMLTQYVVYMRRELKKSLCTADTVKFAFEYFAFRFEHNGLLEFVKEHVVRLFFNVMLDHFGFRVHDDQHYTCVRSHMLDVSSELIESITKPFLLYLGQFQMIVKLTNEIDKHYHEIMEMDASDQCVRELTRMQYCQSCSGHICIRTCMGYCRDTLYQCLDNVRSKVVVFKELQEVLSVLWKEVSSSDMLSQFPRLIVKGFLPLLEARSNEIIHKFHQCQRWKSDVPTNVTNTRVCNPSYKKPWVEYPTLEQSLSFTVYQECVSEVPTLIGGAHERLCELDKYAGSEWVGWPCWTGSYIGRYFTTRNQTASTTLLPPSYTATWNLSSIINCTSSVECIQAFKVALSQTPHTPGIIDPKPTQIPPNSRVFNEIDGPNVRRIRGGIPRTPLLVLPRVLTLTNTSNNTSNDDAIHLQISSSSSTPCNSSNLYAMLLFIVTCLFHVCLI
jgi:hypothetical protein